MSSQAGGMNEAWSLWIWSEQELSAGAKGPEPGPVALERDLGKEREDRLQTFVRKVFDPRSRLGRTGSDLGLITSREEEAPALWSKIGLEIQVPDEGMVIGNPIVLDRAKEMAPMRT